VVTFVGQAGSSNNPPLLSAVSDRTMNAGVMLLVTNTAVDPDMPAEVLTFSLLNGPGNATLSSLNASNALLTWRPLVSQANSTNLIRVKVADNGSPVLSATNSYTIVVAPLLPPGVSSITAAGGRTTLIATGALGPDYTLLTSTNLVDWQPLLTTNPSAMPLILQDTNSTGPVRFYRFQLGP
jgi:hypothetical protein